MSDTNPDRATADAFSTSWNSLSVGSIYTYDQFVDWLAPLTKQDVQGQDVLELGCGNGSLMRHTLEWQPKHLYGIDLGGAVHSARASLNQSAYTNWTVEQTDLVTYQSEGFDLVYCIGVLHHLKDPEAGFRAVVANVRSGGCLHCWVYAKEGNSLVMLLVEPIRKIASKLPWRINKYLVAVPLALFFFLYAKILVKANPHKVFSRFPMYCYCQWIAKRGFSFFHHVVFDQLVTPQTEYLERSTIENWLKDSRIDPSSTYILMRNGNSWKFGGRVYESIAR
jgi:SAM-dependent methyltransferase